MDRKFGKKWWKLKIVGCFKGGKLYNLKHNTKYIHLHLAQNVKCKKEMKFLILCYKCSLNVQGCKQTHKITTMTINVFQCAWSTSKDQFSKVDFWSYNVTQIDNHDSQMMIVLIKDLCYKWLTTYLGMCIYKFKAWKCHGAWCSVDSLIKYQPKCRLQFVAFISTSNQTSITLNTTPKLWKQNHIESKPFNFELYNLTITHAIMYTFMKNKGGGKTLNNVFMKGAKML